MPSAKRRTRASKPKLYHELASWFHLVTAPRDYKEEAAFYRRLLVQACDRRSKTLLELGSGGGNNASHMKRHFQKMTLVDLSPAMLKVSRTLNPECEHIVGDMRRVRLGRQFDAVFVHDAIMYMTTEDDLRRTIETAFVHLRPGGAAVITPDHVRETFREETRNGGHDGDGRALRYVEWTWDPDPRDTTYNVHFAYMLREGKGPVRVVEDRHLFGLFPRRVWLRLLRGAGFDARMVPYNPGNHGQIDVFLAVRRP